MEATLELWGHIKLPGHKNEREPGNTECKEHAEEDTVIEETEKS